MKKDNYSNSLQILAQELNNFQELLTISFQSGAAGNSKIWSLEQIMNSVQNIKVLTGEFESVKSLTLINQDYSNFCFLLFEGSIMADYLLAKNNTPKKMQRLASYWKDTAVKFKPFLENSIYNEMEVGIHQVSN